MKGGVVLGATSCCMFLSEVGSSHRALFCPLGGDTGERAGRGEGLPEVPSLGKRQINVRLFDP